MVGHIRGRGRDTTPSITDRWQTIGRPLSRIRRGPSDLHPPSPNLTIPALCCAARLKQQSDALHRGLRLIHFLCRAHIRMHPSDARWLPSCNSEPAQHSTWLLAIARAKRHEWSVTQVSADSERLPYTAPETRCLSSDHGITCLWSPRTFWTHERLRRD